MTITLTEFTKKIDKNILNIATEYAFKSAKINNIKIYIKDIDLEKANYSTLLDCINKKALTALIIQILEQTSKKLLDIKIDNSINSFLKKVFAENDKDLRALIIKYYDQNKIKDINEINDEIDDNIDVDITSSFTYFIIYNDKLIQKKNEGDINEIIKEKELDTYAKGKYFSSGIYLIEQEKNLNAVDGIKKNDSKYKKIYRINNINDNVTNIKRLALKIL